MRFYSGLKKQIVKLTQVQEDCDKKEKENEKKSSEFRNEFAKACQQLGIEGAKPRKEIIALLDDLPKIYSSLTEECRKLEPAVTTYQDFVAMQDMELLPTLKVSLVIKFEGKIYESIGGNQITVK